MDSNERTLHILLDEYKAIKAEQRDRIGFRDNLLYVTLGLFGALASFAITNEKGFLAFLVIPWVCLVMGWTYVVNDEKISAIGRHIRYTLEKRISALMGGSADNKYLFGWETAHRDDSRRTSRKYIQLFIDQVTFVCSGFAALIGFWTQMPEASDLPFVLSIFEAVLLVILGIKIFVYADLAKGY